MRRSSNRTFIAARSIALLWGCSRSLPACSGIAQQLCYNGIDLTDTFAYSMMKRVLDKAMNAFE